jgi:hypothetical protein
MFMESIKRIAVIPKTTASTKLTIPKPTASLTASISLVAKAIKSPEEFCPCQFKERCVNRK